MRTIAIINQKGGCGKTTTAINLAGVFARRGARTLLIDMDPQSHCAAGFVVPEQGMDMDIGDAMLLTDPARLDPARLLWRVSRNLDLAPSRMKLAGLEAARGGLADRPDREQRLAAILTHLADRYDICLIDCAPSIGLLTYNAIIASDAVLIPVETSFFSLQGATKQVGTVRSLSRRFGLKIPHWLVPTLHEPASPHSKDLLDELRRRFDRKVVPVAIRRDAALKEAASFGQPVFDYAPTSPGAADYSRLADWIAGALRIPLPEAAPFDYSQLPDPLDPADEAFDDAAVTIESPAPSAPLEPDTHPTIEVRTAPGSGQAMAERLGLSPTRTLPIVAPPAGPDRPTSFEVVPPSPGDEPPAEVPAQPAELRAQEVPVETISRAEDMLRRAQAMQRRVQGAAAPVVIAPVPDDLAERLERVGGLSNVRHLFGARPTSRGILFVQPAAVGQRVAIAGEFNQWSETAHIMRRNDDLGVFELTVSLPPGRYPYRLIVDGVWMPDPYNPQFEPNPFGERNSFVVLR